MVLLIQFLNILYTHLTAKEDYLFLILISTFYKFVLFDNVYY